MSKLVTMTLLATFLRTTRCNVLNRCHRRSLTSVKVKDVKNETNSSKKWQAVIGLEVHAQILTSSKLFSSSGTEFATPINQQVSFFDAALPGTLPVINRKCVEAGIKTALALNCHINLVSKFDRKHYFYADLPAGYQITQQRQALANDGELVYYVKEGKELVKRKARITQLQLEQDSGKSLHDPYDKISLIDLNRAGIGLMEIVTAPDFATGAEAADFIREIRLLLLRIGTCDCKMSEGSLRVDASVSLHEPGQPLGVRSEVKNINSMKYVSKAIDFEIMRQRAILDQGEEVINETRSYDSAKKETIAMRDKERLHDYRFMPEPNLPPLRLNTDRTMSSSSSSSQSQNLINIDDIRRCLPALPHSCRYHLMSKYYLTLEEACDLIAEEGMQEVFERLVTTGDFNIPNTYTFLMSSLLHLCNQYSVSVLECPLSFEQIYDLLDMVNSQSVTENAGKKVLRVLFEKPDQSPQMIVDHNNWTMIHDHEVIISVIDDIIHQNPDALKNFKLGKKKVERFFINRAKTALQDRVEPELMISLVLKQINA